MNIIDFISKLNLTRSKIISERSRLALLAAHDLNATIKLRLQTKGEDFNNVQFSPYTPEYEKQRKKQGYQTKIVDFTKRGRLMANINPQVVKNDSKETIVNIGARSADKQIILRGQARKRGNILTPSQAEIKKLENNYSNLIVSLVKTNL